MNNKTLHNLDIVHLISIQNQMNYAWPRLEYQKKYFDKHCSINKPRKEIKKHGFVREPRPSRNEKKKWQWKEEEKKAENCANNDDSRKKKTEIIKTISFQKSPFLSPRARFAAASLTDGVMPTKMVRVIRSVIARTYRS